MPTFGTLAALTQAVISRPGLYVRWSRGPGRDLKDVSSTDDLTGVPLPGLSASPLDIEAWWGERPPDVWVARRLYDYCHLPRRKGSGTRPWVLHGAEAARGPDNEPLVTDIEPVGWIANAVIVEATSVVAALPGAWGPMDRDGDA